MGYCWSDQYVKGELCIDKDKLINQINKYNITYGTDNHHYISERLDGVYPLTLNDVFNILFKVKKTFVTETKTTFTINYDGDTLYSDDGHDACYGGEAKELVFDEYDLDIYENGGTNEFIDFINDIISKPTIITCDHGDFDSNYGFSQGREEILLYFGYTSNEEQKDRCNAVIQNMFNQLSNLGITDNQEIINMVSKYLTKSSLKVVGE